MRYQITSDNIELSPSMEILAKEKFARVEHRLKNIDEDSKSVRIVLNKADSKEDKFTVKIFLSARGKGYFSDETDFTLEGALIKVVEEILEMLHRDQEEAWDRAREAKL